MYCGNGSFAFTTTNDANPPFVASDIVGHEFMHGVNRSLSNLTYQGESGAIDESLSDIFGNVSENETVGSSVVDLIGESVQALRSMRAPKAYPGGVDDYATRYIGTGDYGGVHYNSGIANVAFILMTYGGKHPSSGREMPALLRQSPSIRLWWEVASRRLSSGSTIKELATATVATARSQLIDIKAVVCAWEFVNVFTAAESREFSVECSRSADAGTDASTRADGGGPGGDGGVTRFPDSCAGLGDGLYCSSIDLRAAFRCQSGSRGSAEFCPQNQTCAGPNGEGELRCSGAAGGSSSSGGASSSSGSPNSSSGGGSTSSSSGGAGNGGTCSNDGECNPGRDGSGLICAAGRCVPGCRRNSQCAGNEVCSNGTCGARANEDDVGGSPGGGGRRGPPSPGTGSADVVFSYSGSCEFLGSCSLYSRAAWERNPGTIVTACNGRTSCEDGQLTIAAPRGGPPCGGRVRVCRKDDPARCVDATVSDRNPGYSASAGVAAALGWGPHDRYYAPLGNEGRCTGSLDAGSPEAVVTW